MVDEMLKFRNLLDEKKIPWEDCSDSEIDIDRTHFEYNGYKISAINGFGTYGGYNGVNYLANKKEQNLGLIEVMISGDEPVGWLTAEETWKFIEEKCV